MCRTYLIAKSGKNPIDGEGGVVVVVITQIRQMVHNPVLVEARRRM